ncbi:MAG: hypothetical protein WAU33_00500 [Candidatus Binataceae bacterium]
MAVMKASKRADEFQSGGATDAGDADSCALEPGAVACDVCGAAMKPMGHCKYWCLRCGFLRTCNDTM